MNSTELGGIGVISQARREVAQSEAAGNRTLQLVAGNHLCHFEKDRHIRVAQLNDVEQGLLLPGIADRTPVVDAIMWHRCRPDAAARNKQKVQNNGRKSLAHG